MRKIRRRRVRTENTESKLNEKFRSRINDNTSLSMYNKKKRYFCVIRKDLAKTHEIEVEASEAPITNKILNDPESYEISLANVKILEEEVLPINNAIKKVFGIDKDLKLHSIELAIGGSLNDYVSIRENDLVRYDVKPTLSGLMDFIKENDDSILGFMNCDYIAEEGNVIYLSCGRKNISENVFSIKLKILASMQQRGFFLQAEHKYYGLQLYLIIESKRQDDDKFLDFLKEIEIDWELIFFRRRLAIHDWTEIECERNSENLKSYLRAKYDNLNYFDVNNIIRVVVKNKLPFTVANKMASLLYKMKYERANQQSEKRIYDGKQRNQKDPFLGDDVMSERSRRSSLRARNNQSIDDYSITLKKAEIVASAKLACAYLGIQREIKFDRDISITEILKFEKELSNF